MYEKIINRLASRKGNLVLVSDEFVFELHTQNISKQLRGKSAKVIEYKIAVGERSKSFDSYLNFINFLFQSNVKKNDTLVAVGGGVTSDLVGFVATTYMRGIEFVFIPTTLMAMVDAANGGKNGINLDHGKNLVGTTSLPFEIIFDKIFLQTLSSEVYLEGFMEIIKYGLIFDKDFFLDLVKGQMAESKMIERSIQIKNQICSLDPEDFSTRRILNFGHTIGHGLEKMFDYEISHGKAIFFGMILEAHISFQKRYLALEELDFVKNYFLSVGKGFLSISNIDPNLLWSHMQFDKKNEFEKVRCVVLKRIGKCVTFSGNFCTYLSFNELANSLNWLKNKFLI